MNGIPIATLELKSELAEILEEGFAISTQVPAEFLAASCLEAATALAKPPAAAMIEG